MDENGVETITPKSGSQKRNCKHESVPDHTEQKEICNSVLSDYDVEMPHVQEIVTFDLTHLESSQNRPILSHMNFQIHLDMGTEILKPGFDVAGPNAIEIPPEWQDYPELNIRLDKVTELKLGSSATDDKTVWIQHRHPSWNSTTYQEPQMKRSTVKLTFKKAEDAGRFLRIISPAIPKRCMPDVTDEIVQDHIR